MVLGGNSVTLSLSNNQIKEKATVFYMLLKDSVRPQFLNLAVQTEPGFVPGGTTTEPKAKEFNRQGKF